MVKITACLVVYNEEQNIARCLESLRGAVDEIILVHDGGCQDRTLDIAYEYGVKIFIRPHMGMMEAHLVFALQQSTGDWVMRIDADEFLSPDLKINLRRLVVSAAASGISAYSFRWADFNQKFGNSAKNSEPKTILFKKTELYWFNIPHLAWQTRGKIKNTNYILSHLVKRPTGFFLSPRQRNLAKIQASYILKDFVDLDNFQAKPEDWKKFYNFSRRWSGCPWLALIKFSKSLSEELVHGVGFKKALKRARYNFYLGYYLYILTRHR